MRSNGARCSVSPEQKITHGRSYRAAARAFRAASARVSFKEVILPSLLALNADHRAIGGLHVSFSIQRYLDGKTPRPLTSNDLNADDGLTTGPMSDGLKTLFPESPVV
jgi:hypothetical protein